MSRVRTTGRRTGAVLAAAITTSLLTGGFAAASVHPNIVGGEVAGPAPWAAQVYTEGQFNCSGTVIAPEWVMTAVHCLSDTMSVRVGSNDLGGGTEIAVDRQETAPDGDISLLHLTQAANTDAIALGDADPANGATNEIYGWGRETPTGPPASQLKTTNVTVTGQSTDAYNGPAIQSEGVNGSAWKGDSGGPQLSDGKQVGVASTVQNQDGSNPQGTNNYASVANSRSWISQTAGV